MYIGSDWNFTSVRAASYCGFGVIGRLMVGGTFLNGADLTQSRFGNLVSSRYNNVVVNGQYGATIVAQYGLSSSTPSGALMSGQLISVVAQATSGSPSIVGVYGLLTSMNVGGPFSGAIVTFNNVINIQANWTGSVNYRSMRDGLVFAPGAAGVITSYEVVSAEGCPNTSTANCTDVAAVRASSNLRGLGVNVVVRGVEQTTGTINAIVFADTNAATCGAGFVAGTAGDTCLYRGRAGAWTGPAGVDFYTDSGSICAGATCSSLSTSAQGIYDAGVQVFSTVSCTGATCTKSGKNLDIVVTGTAGVASITGTANQITASASTGAVTLSTPNPFEANQAAPTINSYGSAIGTAGNLGTITGSNNAFWVTVTTGSSPSAGGLIARLDWANAWTSATTANGPACRVSITNAEGVADPAGFMSTYGPKLYAIPVSGSENTSVDLKLAAGASGVALPAVTSFQVLVTCNLVR